MSLISVPAHFDGERIVLDEPVEIEANSRLLVTILPKHDDERSAWVHLALDSLGRAYGDDEPDYTLSAVKEANAKYEGG